MTRELRNHLAGMAAEDAVLRSYAISGHQFLERRWRGQAGEIDLILQAGAEIVFVEVKASRSFDTAALRLSKRQITRIVNAVGEYLEKLPLGQMTPARFDVALVNHRGEVRVMENALA